ncbi:hypothetical protein ABB37_00709 [Leptomonas pyrrhocoris]|uniref:Uncharacterized protein n=1 Tax=Leptomonas pyrrhocoris TaxID=157538 RepID=A0A0N0VI19_LEPPY|nr:hypothetical protein ABB37_00709 [Leptomonas pyrrhocoris]KPA86578.1 hypothetical protein ABB37_00709 [Leptomonas pyrrhocoris]|eukprot:XP_015665017.1 hypothetical protein ABB37_00709 [Leptomonas pyrrhocoris]
MPLPLSASQSKDIREDVAELRSAVAGAVQIAHKALKRVQQQQQQQQQGRSQGLGEDALHEHLCAFESFIIRRVREETASGRVAAEERHIDSNAPTAAVLLGRKIELQLEAQRTRSTTMDQRLGQLESKLNALMSDVVTQSQREAARQKQLTSIVHERVEAEMRAVVVALPNGARQDDDTPRRASTRTPSEVVNVSVLQHVTAALAAMHERVEEQHVELTRWRQQHYSLMDAIVKQMSELKNENAERRQEVSRLQKHLLPGVPAVAFHATDDEDDTPVVWTRRAAT